MIETVIMGALFLFVAGFFGACVWAMNDPQLMQKLREAWAPGEPPEPDNDRD